jgi:hypothetical protein
MRGAPVRRGGRLAELLARTATLACRRCWTTRGPDAGSGKGSPRSAMRGGGPDEPSASRSPTPQAEGRPHPGRRRGTSSQQ